jgi:hypothetical protein
MLSQKDTFLPDGQWGWEVKLPLIHSQLRPWNLRGKECLPATLVFNLVLWGVSALVTCPPVLSKLGGSSPARHLSVIATLLGSSVASSLLWEAARPRRRQGVNTVDPKVATSLETCSITPFETKARDRLPPPGTQLDPNGNGGYRCGARLGGAQSNVFNPTLRLINRKVLR